MLSRLFVTLIVIIMAFLHIQEVQIQHKQHQQHQTICPRVEAIEPEQPNHCHRREHRDIVRTEELLGERQLPDEEDHKSYDERLLDDIGSDISSEHRCRCDLIVQDSRHDPNRSYDM